MKRLAFTLAALLASTGAAAAQSNGFYGTGSIQYEYLLPGDGSTHKLGATDLTIGTAFGGGGSAEFGVELGAMWFMNETSLNEYVLFPTLWMDSAYGRFSIGAPRSAAGSAISFPRIGGSNAVLLEFRYITDITDYIALDSDSRSYGVRYDGQLGSFDAGLSLHGFTGAIEGYHSVTGSVGRDYGAFEFALAFESVSGPSESFTTYIGKLGYDAGRYGAHLTVASGDRFPDTISVADAFYRPLGWLTLEATVANFGGSENLYGASAEASFLDNAYAGVGILDKAGSGDPAYTAYVGWKLNY